MPGVLRPFTEFHSTRLRGQEAVQVVTTKEAVTALTRVAVVKGRHNAGMFGRVGRPACCLSIYR